MREKSHIIVLLIALFLAAAALVFSFIQPSGTLASATETACCAASPAGSYQSPQCCAGCHPFKHQTWSQTVHASARVDPLFLTDLQDVHEPGECYSCHTTGYELASSRYALPGVTCEACHSPYQPGHSADTMALRTSPNELCGSCHVQTLEAWQAGDHGEPDQTCNSCHPPH
jgi:predicted CXXCH cytochrome family protein